MKDEDGLDDRRGAVGAAAELPQEAPALQSGHGLLAEAADFSALPPTFIAVGELDCFRDEDLDYAARLRAHGVPVELHLYPGTCHAFDLLAPESQLAATSSGVRCAVNGRPAPSGSAGSPAGRRPAGGSGHRAGGGTADRRAAGAVPRSMAAISGQVFLRVATLRKYASAPWISPERGLVSTLARWVPGGEMWLQASMQRTGMSVGKWPST